MLHARIFPDAISTNIRAIFTYSRIPIANIVFASKYWLINLSKQYRPRSDAALCGVWSGSILFAQVYQSILWSKYGICDGSWVYQSILWSKYGICDGSWAWKKCFITSGCGLGGSVGLHPTGDQEVAGSTPAGLATFFRWDWSWNIFYGHSLPSTDSRTADQFLAKECAQYWLTA